MTKHQSDETGRRLESFLKLNKTFSSKSDYSHLSLVRERSRLKSDVKFNAKHVQDPWKWRNFGASWKALDHNEDESEFKNVSETC